MDNFQPKRPHHQRVMKLLESFDAELLANIGCYFGGGTAISLLNNEFRLSTDVDFLCASSGGYSTLRELVFDDGLVPLFKPGKTPKLMREVRSGRDGIRAVAEVDGVPIKIELILEARIKLESEPSFLPVPTLSKTSLFAEKLLANADRGMDKYGLSKDIIDIMMMESYWGATPKESISIANNAYGDSIFKAYKKVIALNLEDPKHLEDCFNKLDIDSDCRAIILNGLHTSNIAATTAVSKP